ncbi:MAG: 23S rRNA (guanosine(2251)-2'-O)-methyltransferase RlmB [Proteobacteria bacterium]|nr:23S rRNA (guanosine(2251)-2'-O)-methyltransferase RlmB [Pseudomonadota bacterium]MBU1686754.1 23S rRNA (guanosine(2251)-2'-O)-methyltransferase RlmB [Pseudomonadota bacterium]
MSDHPLQPIWGIHPVLEFLINQPEQIRSISILRPGTSAKLQRIAELAREKQVSVQLVGHLPLTGQDAPNHQGVCAILAEPQVMDLDELLRLAAKEESAPFFVALDSIQDPHNLGAIIRSAAAAGAAGVILPRDRTAPLNGAAAKVSAGALAHIKIARVTNLTDSLKKLKSAGFWIYGADGEAKKTIYDDDFSGPVCIVIGAEGKGIRPLVRKSCDHLVMIPMPGRINSLNAAVAAGIILFEIARQRRLA